MAIDLQVIGTGTDLVWMTHIDHSIAYFFIMQCCPSKQEGGNLKVDSVLLIIKLVTTKSVSVINKVNGYRAVKDKLTEEKMKLVWFLMIVFVQKSLQDDENTTVVGVTRRLSFDIYRLDDARGHEACNEDLKVVYLVDDRQCVTEQELLKGKQNVNTILAIIGDHNIPIGTECSSAITPFNSSGLTAIASISETIVKFEAMFRFREANQTINSSVCDIASLEVYRGVKQAIEISHQGFTLSENGSIKVKY